MAKIERRCYEIQMCTIETRPPSPFQSIYVSLITIIIIMFTNVARIASHSCTSWLDDTAHELTSHLVREVVVVCATSAEQERLTLTGSAVVEPSRDVTRVTRETVSWISQSQTGRSLYG